MAEITNPRRLNALEQTALLDAEADPTLSRLTETAAALLNAPVSLVSLVDKNRQFFAGSCGLPSPWDEERETPLSHSFCQHVVVEQDILKITDARTDHRVKDNLAVRDLNVIAYLGVPIVTEAGEFIGSFCVIDSKPREWTTEDIDHIRNLTSVVASVIEARSGKSVDDGILTDVVIHDTQNPLTSIKLSACLLKERIDVIDESLHPLIDSLVDSSDQLSRLLKNISDERNKQLEPSAGSVCDAVESCCERYRDRAVEKNISIYTSDFQDAPKIRIENWKLERIVENLLSNAIKFTKSGGDVLIEPAAGKGVAGFTIRDCGPGFSGEDIPKMFSRYTILSGKPTGGENSTGLGLSIVKNLIDQNGGTIELIPNGESTGAKFLVLFPIIS